MHKLQDIGLWIQLPIDLGAVCNILKALLEPSGITYVDSENLYLRQTISNSISVFDSKLRFVLQQLAISIN